MHWIALQPRHEAVSPLGTAGAAEPAQGLAPSADPQTLADELQALGWWALRFTPRVALQEPAQAVLLEVSASERLFGGRRPLIAQLLGAGCPLAHIRVTRAPSALLALARLQVEPAAGRDPDQLPLHTLADARPHLATLERIGCQCWGDLRALPRGGVVRRFGAPLLDALDRAYGLKPEVFPWLVLPEVFDMPLELQARVEAAPALLFAARRLLAQLRVWLQARQRGVLAFELRWQMDARRDTASEAGLVVRTAAATLDMVHLQRLLAENLERVTLSAPVLYLRLRTVETAALSGATTSLLPDEQRKGDDLLQLLERLAARLGPEQVLRSVARADHRPEHMQAWLPATGGAATRPATGRSAGPPTRTGALAAAASAGAGGRRGRASGNEGRGDSNSNTIGDSDSDSNGNGNGNAEKAKARAATAGGGRTQRAPARSAPSGLSDALYPTWLLDTPLKLAVRRDCPLYQGPLTLLAGPQRIEAAWWDVMALRDYFLAHSTQAGLLWIYRERLTARRIGGDQQAGDWYLHGVFG
ncbi:DNA polymerase Y family protein [Comamonadaceae bacterium G21597-S1]|nr:DNA polymerase Y family protein [Comamonadaceae bacterium G21597-S1]